MSKHDMRLVRWSRARWLFNWAMETGFRDGNAIWRWIVMKEYGEEHDVTAYGEPYAQPSAHGLKNERSVRK